ncbi:MAG: hypothetical protein JNK21_03715 [Rhodospirillaceae bacterium]|nr:hypothetical protein [Rhodospirillaceae bacterium]
MAKAWTLTRRLAAFLGIMAMLGLTMAAGQARAAHIVSLMNTAAAPCHQGLSSDEVATPMPTPGELCRELCLSHGTDAMVVATPAAMPDVRVIFTPAPAHTSFAMTLPKPAAHAPIVPDHAPKLRRAPYPATPRLLI